MRVLKVIIIINNKFNQVPFLYCFRILSFAKDYATKRVAFQKYLTKHPLHMRTLAAMEV